MNKPEVQIVWFKRDLRVYDHAPMFAASHEKTPTIPLYIIEPDYWQQPFASRKHWHFIHDSITELRKKLASLGQPLVIRTGEIMDILAELQNTYTIKTIQAHEETGNLWTYNRDKAVIKFCAEHNINLIEHPNNGVVRRLKSRDDWSKIRNARIAQDCIPPPKSLVPCPDISIGDIPPKDDAIIGKLGSRKRQPKRRATKKKEEDKQLSLGID